MERIRCMVIKEFILVLRDPKMRAVILVTPLLQLMMFGYAVSTDVNNIDLAIFDLDNSVNSREIITRFSQSGYFNIIEYIHNDTQAQYLVDAEKVRAVVRINHGFSGEQESGHTSTIQILVDGTDSNTARIVLDYASRVLQAYTHDRLNTIQIHLTGKKIPSDAITLEHRAWFNENLESRNFYVPGVIATLLMLITLILTSMAIVREREIGTMEQIIATPITQFEFILGKSIPFALIGYVIATLITLIGVYWFNIPIRGSLTLLFLGISVYLLNAIGIGLLISTVCHTQQQAMITTFFFFTPFMLLSGFVFPISNMPTIIQWITYLDPLRYILIIIRGIFLKGVGFKILWPQIAALLLYGIATLTIATTRLRKTLS